MVDLNKNQLLTIATVLIICAFFGNGTYQQCLSSLQNIVIREGESALLSCSVAPNGIQWSVTPTSNSTRTYIIVAYNGSVNPVLNGFYSYDPSTGLTVRSGTTYATGYDIATAGVYVVNFNASSPNNKTAFKVVVIRSGPDCSCTQLSNGSVTVSCAMVYADHPARNTEINEVMNCTANGQRFDGTTAPRIQLPGIPVQYVWNQTSSFTTTDTGPTTYNCIVSFSAPPPNAPAYLAKNAPSYNVSIPVFCGTTTTMLTTTTQLTTTTKSPTTTSKPLSTEATTAGPTTTQPTTTKTTSSVTTPGPTTSRPATTPGPTTQGPTTSRPATTPGPTTPGPTTPGPTTSQPATTPGPTTPGPTTPGPTTPGPTTPRPTTPGPTTPGPTTPGPTTSQPATTSGPTTPGPTTPGPTTPGPTTPGPTTPGPTTPGPTTSQPATTPGPTTPGPTTPGPTTPGPTTPGPTTPGPTASQTATAPGPTTPGPTASEPATTPGPTTTGPTTPGPTISQSEKTAGPTTPGPTASASQQASPISTSEATLPSASTQSTTTVVIPSVATTEPVGATTQSTTTTTTPTAINATSVSPIPEVTTSVGPTTPSTAPLSSTPPLVLNPTTSPPTLTIPLATAGQPTSSTTVNIGLLSTKIVLGTVLGVLMAATALLGCCWGFLYCCPLFSAVAPARLPTQYIVDEVQWLPRRDWIPVPREMHYRVIPFYKQSFCKCPTPLEYRLPRRGGCVTDFQRPARMAPPPPRLTYVYEDTCA